MEALALTGDPTAVPLAVPMQVRCGSLDARQSYIALQSRLGPGSLLSRREMSLT